HSRAAAREHPAHRRGARPDGAQRDRHSEAHGLRVPSFGRLAGRHAVTALGSVRLDELAASLADGTVTPVDVVDATAECHDRTRELNAFLAVDFDLARSRAVELVARGRTDGPLWG